MRLTYGDLVAMTGELVEMWQYQTIVFNVETMSLELHVEEWEIER